MLWLYAFFPCLSIEALNCSKAQLNRRFKFRVDDQRVADHQPDYALFTTLPLVVADGPELRPIVHALNDEARISKITPGITIASAKVLQHDLIVMTRDANRERRTLERIASALLQFTPAVAIEADVNRAGIALEIAKSLTLFGGLELLIARIQKIIARLNYEARFGLAPNATAASLLARSAGNAIEVPRCLRTEALSQHLAPLSVHHFAWPRETFVSLATLGLDTIADVVRQPYEGLRKRFGDSFVLDLDRAHGKQSDVRSFYEAPDTFESRLDFAFEVKEAALLLMPIEELLVELEGFLRARGAGVTEIHIALKQGRSRAQHFDFRSRTPLRDAAHWLRFVSDRIESCDLDEPVIEVTLTAQQLVELKEHTESLFPQEKANSSEWFTLLDRLASQLGEKSVYRIAAANDHRPELAWKKNSDDKRVENSSLAAQKIRPTWLLREPRSLIEMEGSPQYHGALMLLAGPERIDTGWWDNKPVARDYFVAINRLDEVCWIFKDYRQGRRWYLHGFFS